MLTTSIWIGAPGKVDSPIALVGDAALVFEISGNPRADTRPTVITVMSEAISAMRTRAGVLSCWVSRSLESTMVDDTPSDHSPQRQLNQSSLSDKLPDMPSPPNTRHEDPDVAPLVKRLEASGKKVARVDEERNVARATRRQIAAEAFEAGISWKRIAAYGGYGTAQAAQQDVTHKTMLGRRSTDL
jgi:hypothetical protein